MTYGTNAQGNKERLGPAELTVLWLDKLSQMLLHNHMHFQIHFMSE